MKRFFLAMIVALSTFFCGSAIASEGTFIGNTIKGIDHVYYFLANPVGSLTLDGDAVHEVELIEKGGHVFIPNLSLRSAVASVWSDFSKHGTASVVVGGIAAGIGTIAVLFHEDSIKNLLNAWLLGRAFLPYNVVYFNTTTDMNSGKRIENWHFLGTQMDGASIVVYTLSWVIHTPQKFVRNIAYILHEDASILVLLDMFTNAVQLVFECIFACFGFVINTILGTICHPLDTLFSIPGGIWFSCVSAFTAVIDVFTSVWALFTGFR